MPISYNYNKPKDILIVSVDSEVSLKDVDQFMLEILGSTDFPPETRTIWDLRRADLSSLDADFARQLIDVRKKYPERFKAKVAFVADSDLSFGLLRLYESLSSIALPQNTIVFRTLSKAEEWILSPHGGNRLTDR